ncbi:MAG: Wzz/FepE/Etk N-terminal domain-containing protein [Steroidobacteraceae bacterium]
MKIEHPERIDITNVLALLWAKRWWISGAVLACTAVAIAAAFFITPRYRAIAVLTPASTEAGGNGALGAIGRLGGLASLAGIGFGTGHPATQEALAVLESRQFTESFIGDYGLMPKLFPSRWDAKSGRFRGDATTWPTLADGYQYFNEDVRTVGQSKDTGFVTLEIEWTDPERAAEWANVLVGRLNAEMRRRTIERTGNSLRFLEQELGRTQVVETRQAISRLIEAQMNQRMLANSTQEYAFRFVDRALPPDRTDRSWPPRLLFVLGGFLFGAVASVGLILLLWSLGDAEIKDHVSP